MKQNFFQSKLGSSLFFSQKEEAIADFYNLPTLIPYLNYFAENFEKHKDFLTCLNLILEQLHHTYNDHFDEFWIYLYEFLFAHRNISPDLITVLSTYVPYFGRSQYDPQAKPIQILREASNWGDISFGLSTLFLTQSRNVFSLFENLFLFPENPPLDDRSFQISVYYFSQNCFEFTYYQMSDQMPPSFIFQIISLVVRIVFRPCHHPSFKVRPSLFSHKSQDNENISASISEGFRVYVIPAIVSGCLDAILPSHETSVSSSLFNDLQLFCSTFVQI